jgi:hypothetical protein
MRSVVAVLALAVVLLPSTALGEYLEDRFTYYTDVLLATANQAYATDLYATCTDYYDLCEADTWWESVAFTSSSPLFPGVSVNTSLAGTKLVAGVTAASDANNICFGTNTASTWEKNLKEDTYNAAAWQYIGFQTEGSYVINPLSNWTAGCPGPYDPRQRPWYLSAVTGPINLWIMIDVSGSGAGRVDASLRLAEQKKAANKLLSSLNYWSFVNIGVYTTDTVFMTQILTRGTSDTIQTAYNFVNNIELSESVYVGVGYALESLFSKLKRSHLDRSTSLCHNVIVFLSAEHNDLDHFDVPELLDKHTKELEEETIILTYVFNLDDEVVDRIYKVS